MKISILLAPDILDDLPRLERLVQTLRHTRGIMGLDIEMAESGLLLANVSGSMDMKSLETMEGVERVGTLGVKQALSPASAPPEDT